MDTVSVKPIAVAEYSPFSHEQTGLCVGFIRNERTEGIHIVAYTNPKNTKRKDNQGIRQRGVAADHEEDCAEHSRSKRVGCPRLDLQDFHFPNTLIT